VEGEGTQGVGEYSEGEIVGFKVGKSDASVACGRGAKTLANVRTVTTAVSRFHHHLKAVVILWKGAKPPWRAGGL
jgi:hypothetical protein